MSALIEPRTASDFAGLQSLEHLQLLDVVDELRAQGLSGLLPLPQLIVCGDQSSGKSSVLEAISSIPFPKKDNLCTRFATEVILRRAGNSSQPRIVVSIVPGRSRSEVDQERLNAFTHQLDTVEDLPEVITKAKEAMGLDSDGVAFSLDVLRLEVTGPRMPQLTIVDLPGLIHSENKLQTAQDVEVVAELVESYMEQPRSIILAVISAKNDYANQIVLKKARTFDPSGKRTLGIITKPDTLSKGSDSELAFIELAKNEDIKFELGWHVIRNLDSNSPEPEKGSRDQQEAAFFRNTRWQSIDASCFGIQALRDRLSRVLFRQIKSELPSLISDIEKSIATCSSDLARFGRSRITEKEQELFLIEVGQDFQSLCKASCDGTYEDIFFESVESGKGKQKRIRAFVQNESKQFAKVLATKASSWTISGTPEASNDSLSREEVLKRVVKLIEGSRGRELPGTFNPLLIGELFREYSTPWKQLAQDHVQAVWEFAKVFIGTVVDNVTDNDVRDALFRLIIDPELDQMLKSANEKLSAFIDELGRHPITYNHYLTDTVKKAQNERLRASMKGMLTKAFDEGIGKLNRDNINWLANMILETMEPDMDRVAAETALDYMLAYYKVSCSLSSCSRPLLIS